MEESRDFEMDYFSGTGYQSSGLHRHAFHELLFVTQGRLNFLVDDKLYKAGGSCLILFKEKRLHASEVDRNSVYTRYNLNFRQKFISEITDFEELRACFAADCTVLPVTEAQLPTLSALFSALYENYQTMHSDSYSQSICRHLLVAILTTVSRMACGNPERSGLYIDRSYISDVVRYINDHLSEKLIIADIAGVYFVSRAKLVGDFKAATGITIGEYVTARRLRLAKKLLRAGTDVSTTAARVGFANPCHFIRTFKTHTGTTPLKYAHAAGVSMSDPAGAKPTDSV